MCFSVIIKWSRWSELWSPVFLAKALFLLLVVSQNVASSANNLDSLLSVYQSYNKEEQKAQLANDIGREYIHSGNKEKARYFLDQAINLSQNLENKDLLIEALSNKAVCFILYNQLDSSIILLKEAERIASRTQNKLWQEFLKLQYGDVFNFQNKLDSAYAVYRSATLSNYEDVLPKNKQHIINYYKYYSNFAYLHLRKKNLPAAIKDAKTALEISLKYGDAYRQLKAFKLLSRLEKARYNYPQSIDYLEKALELIRRNNDYVVEKTQIYFNIGNLFLENKDYQKAIAVYDSALIMSQNQIFNTHLVGQILGNLANCYEKTNQKTKAIYFYKKAIVELKKVNKSKEYYWVLGNLSGVYNECSQPDSALQLLTAINPNDVQRVSYYGILVRMGQSYLIQKNYKKAETKLLEALTHKQNSEENLLLLNYKLLSILFSEQKSWKKALEYSEKQRDLENDLWEKDKTKALNKFRVVYDVYQLEKENEMAQKNALIKDAQAKRRLWFSASLILLVLISLILLIMLKRSKANQNILHALELEQYKMKVDKSKLEGEMEERIKISRELHDSILSALAGTRLMINKFQESISDDKQLKEINSISFTIKDTYNRLRKFVGFLKGKQDYEALDGNFYHELQQFIQNYLIPTGINCHLISNNRKKLNEIDVSAQIELLKMMKEIVANIIKHSQANNAHFTFQIDNQFLNITAKDDGIGFDSRSVIYGNGIDNLRKRITKFEGKLNIYSAPNEGVICDIKLPINKLF